MDMRNNMPRFNAKALSLLPSFAVDAVALHMAHCASAESVEMIMMIMDTPRKI